MKLFIEPTTRTAYKSEEKWFTTCIDVFKVVFTLVTIFAVVTLFFLSIQ